MKLAARYVFGRVLSIAVVTLAVTTALMLIIQIMPVIDMVTRSRDALASFFKVSLFLVPTMLVLMAPFALLLATMRTLNQMNGDSELVVLEAAGRSPYATVRPIILLGALASLVTLLMLHVVEPNAQRMFRATLVNAQADLIGKAVQSHTFSKIQDNTWIQVSEELPGGDFGNVLIIDTRDPATELIYYAKRGKLVNHEGSLLLALIDGELHRRDRNGGEVSIISYGSTVFDLAEFSAAAANSGRQPGEYSTAELIAAGQDPEIEEAQRDKVRAEFHRRMTDWLYPLMMVVVAVYFAGSARTQRREQPVQIALGAIVAILLRVAGFIAVSQSGASAVYAAVTYAVPIGAIALFFVAVFTGHSLRFPKLIIDFILTVANAIAAAGRMLGLGGRSQGQSQGASQ